MNPPPVDPATLPLRDIHLPAAVSWWPPALGWWLLVGLGVAALLVATWWLRRYRARRANRAALALLETAATQAATQPLAAVQTVSVALRRFVMTTEQEGAAAITDEAWLALLDSRWNRQGFSTQAGRLLAQAPYMPAERVATDAAVQLIEMARDWLRVQRAAGA